MVVFSHTLLSLYWQVFVDSEFLNIGMLQVLGFLLAASISFVILGREGI